MTAATVQRADIYAERNGRYRVKSDTSPGRFYSVQVRDGRGVCDCTGYLTHGTPCKHIRAALEQERNHMTTETKSTAVAVRDRSADLAPYMPEPPASILPTTDEMKVMVTIANSIYKTAGKLIPSNIKSSEEAFAVMLAGHELGIPAMASFREIYVVNGRTQPSARVLMGLVLRGDPRAKFTWYERSDTRAHARLTRGNGMTLEVEYTIEMATKAGLTKNDVWRTFPTDMLAYKCVTRLCRLGGPDLITSIGATVKGAPQVMAAIEEENDIPALEPDVIDAAPPQDERPAPEMAPPSVAMRIEQRLAQFPADVRGKLIDGINLKYGGRALTPKGQTTFGKGALTAEQQAEVLAFLEKVTLEEEPEQLPME